MLLKSMILKIQHILTKNERRQGDINSRNTTCVKIKCCYINKDGKELWDDINSLFNISFYFYKIFKHFSIKTNKQKTKNRPQTQFLPQNESEDQFYTSILL